MEKIIDLKLPNYIEDKDTFEKRIGWVVAGILLIILIATMFGTVKADGTKSEVTKVYAQEVELIEEDLKLEGAEMTGNVVESTPVKDYSAIKHIKAYRNSRNSNVSNKYIEAIYDACGQNVELTEFVMAVSVAECGMKHRNCTNANGTYTKWNIWGIARWDNYDPQDMNVMAKKACKVMKDYPKAYQNVTLSERYVYGEVVKGKDGKVVDRTLNWRSNVATALGKIRRFK